MYVINGMKYISPLAQVKGIMSGDRKYANVSILREMAGGPLPHTSQAAAGVTA